MPESLYRFRAPLAWALVVAVLHFVPATDALGPGSDWLGDLLLTVPFADKVAHALLFFVLALLTVRALRETGSAAAIRLAIGLGVAYGLLLELGQMLVPGRSPEALDGLADALGAALGAILAPSGSYERRSGDDAREAGASAVDRRPDGRS